MCSAIVLLFKSHYREIARQNWGLTEEQMKGMHVHHRIPVSKGGTNAPENLYVYNVYNRIISSIHNKIQHFDEDSL
jgi:hypothetical protein